MYNNDKIIRKNIAQQNTIKQRTNKEANGNLKGTEKYEIKEKKIEGLKSKYKMEILDNYRYIEIKCIKKDDGKRRSVVKHRRLGQPIGKETSYEKERYSKLPNYSSKSPILSKINSDRKNYNHDQTMKTTLVTLVNSKNSKQTNKNNETYQVKKVIQKSNNSKINQNIEIIQKNITTNINKKKSPLNQQNFNLNKNISTFNQGKTSTNEIKKKIIIQNNIENSNNKNITKENYSNKSPKKQIEKLNVQQKERFKSTQQKKINEGEDEYRHQSQIENLEICKICGKPKRTKGIFKGVKSTKSIKREIIAEEKSDDNYVIRYNTENETNSEPYFNTYRAPGTNFCPIHGYV